MFMNQLINQSNYREARKEKEKKKGCVKKI